jgi:hypothetical protein
MTGINRVLFLALVVPLPLTSGFHSSRSALLYTDSYTYGVKRCSHIDDGKKNKERKVH